MVLLCNLLSAKMLLYSNGIVGASFNSGIICYYNTFNSEKKTNKKAVFSMAVQIQNLILYLYPYPDTLPIPVIIPPAGTSSFPYSSKAANWESSRKGELCTQNKKIHTLNKSENGHSIHKFKQRTSHTKHKIWILQFPLTACFGIVGGKRNTQSKPLQT